MPVGILTGAGYHGRFRGYVREEQLVDGSGASVVRRRQYLRAQAIPAPRRYRFHRRGIYIGRNQRPAAAVADRKYQTAVISFPPIKREHNIDITRRPETDYVDGAEKSQRISGGAKTKRHPIGPYPRTRPDLRGILVRGNDYHPVPVDVSVKTRKAAVVIGVGVGDYYRLYTGTPEIVIRRAPRGILVRRARVPQDRASVHHSELSQALAYVNNGKRKTPIPSGTVCRVVITSGKQTGKYQRRVKKNNSTTL
jgi:hypothetical protein